jgi:hypothetical protein
MIQMLWVEIQLRTPIRPIRTRIDTQPPAADRSTRTTRTVPPSLADTSSARQPGFFDGESDGVGNELDRFVTDVTTIAQSQCEHATDYADVETLVCDLPIDHLTFAAHDSLAPYSGPCPRVLLVRACLLKESTGGTKPHSTTTYERIPRSARVLTSSRSRINRRSDTRGTNASARHYVTPYRSVLRQL